MRILLGYGQNMTDTIPDPRPMMARLWRLSGADAPTVLAGAGVVEVVDPARYHRLRRILSGVLVGDAEEVGIVLRGLAAVDPTGMQASSPRRGEYVLAYLRWKNADELGLLARRHGVKL